MRNIVIILVVIILVVGGFVGMYIGFLRRPADAPSTSASSINTSSATSDFSATMYKIEGDTSMWTRMYVIDVISDNGFAQADLKQLTKSQENLGNTLKTYYGNKTGDTLIQSLKQNTLDMEAFVQAAKAQDTALQNTASTHWYTTANNIADFLAKTNSHWADTDMRFMMKSYVDLTKKEIGDVVDKKYDASVTDYDAIHNTVLQIADTLSIGVRQDFPERF